VPANGIPTAAPSAAGIRDVPLPGARLALILLVLINLFNYIDRQVLAANLEPIEKSFLPEEKAAEGTDSTIAPDAHIKDITEAFSKHADEAVTNGPNEERSRNKELLGDLAMAFMLSYMLLAPLFGWLGDHIPRWWVIGIGVLVWSLASGASGLCSMSAGMTGFWLLFATRCFVGVGEAAYGPIAPTMISDLYPVKIRGKVLSWFYVAIPVGGAIGYMLGGLAGFPWAFYLVVPPGILLAVLCFRMPEPPRGQADLDPTQVAKKAKLKDYLILLKTPSYVFDTLGMTAMTFALGGIAHWMPYYISRYRGYLDKGTVGIIFGGIVVVSGLAATLLGGVVGDRLRGRFAGAYFLVSGFAMLLALPLFCAVLICPFPWCWVFIFLACFCLFFNTGPTNAILANVTHPSMRAAGFALNILVIHLLGDAFSPMLIGMIADATARNGRANMNMGFLAISIMMAVGGLFWLWGARYLDRDTALAPTRLG
jgi:MFS transporter, Spinster family, sphingosine-1-phosphate transporter